MLQEQPELRPIPVRADVWSQVGIDLIGPFKRTERGHRFLVHTRSKVIVLFFPKHCRYIMTMSCYFSKWVEAFPICDKLAECVARALYSAYCRHGAPDEVITDQGREFVNKVHTHWHTIVI